MLLERRQWRRREWWGRVVVVVVVVDVFDVFVVVGPWWEFLR